MNSIYRSLLKRRNNSFIKPRFQYLLYFLFSLVLMRPALLGATVITAQVENDVFLSLKQFKGDIPVFSGSLLPEDAVLKFKNNAKITLLCLETSELRVFRSNESIAVFCNESAEVTIRSDRYNEIPFVVIPNQRTLSNMDRVIWTGLQGDSYSIKLIHSDTDGREKELRNWSNITGRYVDSGYYEFRLEKPLNLPLAESGEHYRIEVIDEDNSYSSLEHGRLCKAITAQTPVDAVKKANEVIETLNVHDHLDYVKLIVAAQLSAQGYRAEAYSLLDSMLNSDYEVEKLILKARLLNIPGIPLEVVVKAYGIALKEAVKRADKMNAIIACRGVAVDASLLSRMGYSEQSELLNNPEYSPYCP